MIEGESKYLCGKCQARGGPSFHALAKNRHPLSPQISQGGSRCSAERGGMIGGFLKLVRGRDAEDLFRDPLAYTLLSLIAYRARRSEGLGVHGLEPGEALIGDHESVGMTRKQYRVRLNRLVCGSLWPSEGPAEGPSQRY